MIRPIVLCLSLSFAAVNSIPAQTAPPTPAAAYELPPVFQASQILDRSLLIGPNHRVRELAYGDGYLIHFTVDSDFGTYECVGIHDLQRRVREIHAIASLVTVSKSDLFAEGLKKSVEAPIDAVKNIAENPSKAIKQVPHTVGHFFSKIGSSIDNAVRKSGEESPDSTGSESKEGGKGIGGALLGAAGFDKAKLDCARQLGVDPYTDNPRLQEEMEKVTWAFFAGGLPLRVGVAVASSGASAALTATEVVGLPQDIYDVTPGELDYRDRKALEAMGIAPARIDALFANPNVIHSTRHRMVQSLTHFQGKGQSDIIEVLIACDTPWRAQFIGESISLLDKRRQTQPYAAYGVYGRLAVGMTPDGILEVPAPVDYVVWTEEMAAFAARSDIAGSKRRLILDGQLSDRTRTELQAAGWEIIPFPRG